MYKYLLLFLLVLTPLVSAQDFYFNRENELFYIPQCAGDVQILIFSEHELSENELEFPDCRQSAINHWTCQCRNDLNITFIPKKNRVTYGMTVYYNLEYIRRIDGRDPRIFEPDIDEILENSPRRIKSFPEINIKRASVGELNISTPVQIIVFVLVAGVVVLFVFLVKRIFGQKNKNTPDVLGYGVKDEDIEEILKNIK